MLRRTDAKGTLPAFAVFDPHCNFAGRSQSQLNDLEIRSRIEYLIPSDITRFILLFDDKYRISLARYLIPYNTINNSVVGYLFGPPCKTTTLI